MSVTPSGSDPTQDGPRRELSLDQEVGHYVDMWKKAVDVQQHFNDIQWRIRGLALTVATFALGAAGIAAKDGTQIGPVSLGTLVAVVGLLLWYAFYFVDRVWYHPFLRSAVERGTLMEDEIRKTLPHAGLTAGITAGSAQDPGLIARTLSRKPTMQSIDKLKYFYRIGGAAFVLVAAVLQLGVTFDTSSSPDRELRQEGPVTAPAPPGNLDGPKPALPQLSAASTSP